MPYRPQFARETPPGQTDVDFDHYYDNLNTPGLNIPPGNQPVYSIVLNIDPDAVFIWTGLKIPMGKGIIDLGVRFREPLQGRYLQDDFVPAWLFAVPPSNGAMVGGQPCALESEVYCPASSTVLLDVQYQAPQQGAQVIPELIPAPAGGTLGTFSGVQFGAVAWKGNLWEFVVSDRTTNSLGAFISRNQGQSWTAVDTAHNIFGNPAAMFWDGVTNLVTFLYTTGGVTGNPVALRSFDLDAQTWGADFGTAGAPIFFPEAVWIRSTGDIVGLFQDQVTTGEPFKVQVLSGGVWGAAVDVTTGAQALPGYVAADTNFLGPTSIMDSSDVLHILYGTNGSPAPPPNWDNRYFYQQFLLSGALGNFQEIDAAGQQQATQDIAKIGVQPIGKLAIAGNSLVWGAILNVQGVVTGNSSFPAVFVGTPLSAPVWTESASIDANTLFATQNPSSFPNMFYDPITGNLYATWNRSSGSGSGNQIQLAFTRVAGFQTGWQSQTLFDADAPRFFPGTDNGLTFYPLLVFGPNGSLVGLSTDITDTTAGGPEQRYFIVFPGIQIVLTGFKRYGLAAAVPTIQPQTVTAPPVANAPAIAPAGAMQPCPPQYSNLCWALRNGMLAAGQFDPAELLALQQRCATLGYTGACPPPACIGAWLQQNASQLVHIAVTPQVLAALPPAPPIGNCMDSWLKGGVDPSIASGGI